MLIYLGNNYGIKYIVSEFQIIVFCTTHLSEFYNIFNTTTYKRLMHNFVSYGKTQVIFSRHKYIIISTLEPRVRYFITINNNSSRARRCDFGKDL